MSVELKQKHKEFADYYIETGNKTQSYMKAYPNCTYASADASARKLLENTRIIEYINEKTKPKEDKRVASAQEVMEFLTDVMRGKVKDRGRAPSLYDRKDAAKELAKRTIDIEAKKADTDIIANMKTVAELIMGSVPDRKIEDYE